MSAAPPPDLNDPAQRAAYARELRAVARPIRLMGLGLAVLAVLAAAGRAWVPRLPVVIPLFLLVVAALHLLAGVMIRLRYHQNRMRG